MGRAVFLAALAATTSLVEGHFKFFRLAHNGVWQDPLRYIRNNTHSYAEATQPVDHDPVLRRWGDPTYYSDRAQSVRCGRDHMTWAASTETIKVKAGDTFEFATANMYPYEYKDEYLDCEDGRGFCTYKPTIWDGQEYYQYYFMYIVHPGPASTYLSKVPENQTLEQYDGSGNWVKIHTTGVEIRKDMKKPHWFPNNNTDDRYGAGTGGVPYRMPFKIPAQTPAGKYLLRVDLVYNYWQTEAQLYPTCAHIEVENSVSGDLPKGVKFPEAYEPSMPGMTTSPEHSGGYTVDANYTYPGGDLWTGEKMVVDRPDLTPV